MPWTFRATSFLLGLGLACACGASRPPAAPGSAPSVAGAPSGNPPRAAEEAPRARHEPVVEELHGVKVSDPYRWLEDGDAPEVKEWQVAQDARARQILGAVPGRDTLREQARALFRAGGDVSLPRFARAGHGPELYFHTKRSGENDQPVLYVREGVTGVDRVLVDPVKLAVRGADAPPGADSPVAIDWWYASKDGALLAYGTSTNGTELSTLHVRDVKTGTDLPDTIPYTRYATVAWVPDDKGFYYVRLPEPGTVPAGEEQEHRKLFFHRLGNDWHKDKLVFEPGSKEDSPEILLSPGGRWLVVSIDKGYLKNDVLVRDRSKGDGAPWVPVITGATSLTYPTPREERLYLVTNDGAPNGRLYTVEYDHPDRKLWREVLGERKDALEGVAVLRTQVVASYLHDASSRVERFTLGGKSLGALELPSIGSARVTGPWDGDDAFVEFESFVAPPEVLRFGGRAGSASPKGERWDGVGELPSIGDVETTMTYATSKDGTKIPLFVVAKKGLVRDGTSPALLWGYGGFTINQTPTFRPYAFLTVENGGVFASAVLRGGAEFGEAWHQAGMLGNKQNVFDDYAACADELVAEKITSHDKLAAIGRFERRPPRRRRDHAAPGPVSRGRRHRPADGHAPLSGLSHRPVVGDGVRRPGEGRRLQMALRLLPLSSREGRSALPRDAHLHGRERQPGRSDARAQDGGPARRGAGRPVAADPPPGRYQRRSRPGEAGVEVCRRARGRAGLRVRPDRDPSVTGVVPRRTESTSPLEAG